MPSVGVDITKSNKINAGDRVRDEDNTSLMRKYSLGAIINDHANLHWFLTLPGRMWVKAINFGVNLCLAVMWHNMRINTQTGL